MQVVVGRIGRAHGIRGEVGVDLRTDEPRRRFAVGSSLRTGDHVLTVQSARPHSGRMLVAFEEVGDRTAAEELRGCTLTADISPQDRPDDPEEFFDHHLVGLEVRTPDGSVVGSVHEVLHLPAQDTLVVRTSTDREVLIPFVAELVPEVDLDTGFVTVLDRPGLLDPDTAERAGGTEQS